MHERWNKTAASLSISPAQSDAIYACIAALYSHPPRAYHNLNHVLSMLDIFDGVSELADDPLTVELAIWFHDCVYDPMAKDNEEKSADVAALLSTAIGLDEARIKTLRSLILATKHDHSAKTKDEELLVNIDLAILGSPSTEYDAYARAIREEYIAVDDERYRAGRATILNRFLDRPSIFSLTQFNDRYELAARDNMVREIKCIS